MQFRIHTLLILCATLAVALTISTPLNLMLRAAFGAGVLGLWLGAACLYGGIRYRLMSWRSWWLAMIGIALMTISFSAVVYLFGLSLREYVQLLRGKDL